MPVTQTLEQLVELKLFGVVEALNEQISTTKYKDTPFEERLAYLVDREIVRRNNLRVSQKLRNAKLHQKAEIETIIFNPQRSKQKKQILELAQCSWIKNRHNLIISGATGTGKTFIACALADKACKMNLSSLYLKTSQLATQCSIAHADGSFDKVLSRLAKYPLLIIDEWLRDPLKPQQARDILDLLDIRFRNQSTIFVTQLPVINWHDAIGDKTIADALLDRIIHDSFRLELSGDSFRKQTTTLV